MMLHPSGNALIGDTAKLLVEARVRVRMRREVEHSHVRFGNANDEFSIFAITSTPMQIAVQLNVLIYAASTESATSRWMITGKCFQSPLQCNPYTKKNGHAYTCPLEVVEELVRLQRLFTTAMPPNVVRSEMERICSSVRRLYHFRSPDAK